MLLDLVQRRLDVAGLVLHDGQRHIVGKQILAFGEQLLNAVDDGHGVFARLPLHLQHNGRLPVEAGQRADFLRGVVYLAQIAQPHGGAVDVRDDQVVELARVRNPPQRAERPFSHAFVQAAAGHLGVLPHHGIANLQNGKLIGRQPAGVDIHLHGAVRGAGDQHFADSVRRLDDVLHVPVGQHEELARRARSGNGQGQNRRGVQVALLHDRRVDARRKTVQRAGHGVAHVLNRGVDVAVQLECDDDEGSPVARDRAKLLDAGHRCHGVLDERADFRLHFLGRGPRVGRLHEDLRQVHVGKPVHSQLRKSRQAGHHQRHDQHQGEYGTAHADFSKPIQSVFPRMEAV